MTVAIVIAGGVGARMGADVPKQFVQVNGKPVLFYTLEAFERHPMVDALCRRFRPEHKTYYAW